MEKKPTVISAPVAPIQQYVPKEQPKPVVQAPIQQPIMPPVQAPIQQPISMPVMPLPECPTYLAPAFDCCPPMPICCPRPFFKPCWFPKHHHFWHHMHHHHWGHPMPYMQAPGAYPMPNQPVY